MLPSVLHPGEPSSKPVESSPSGGLARARGLDGPAFSAILGDDPDLVHAKRMVARFAPTPLPLLLLAETGTGKELFARATHAASARSDGPFVALNCGALTPSLLESELFGHAPGAFTGAQRAGSTGKLAAADGGTLFLDEIAEMPEALQAALLRVLEDGSYYRVGDSRARRSDFRLVCATCRDLPALVHAGRFRRDLFFRIQGACVTIPPLRARSDRLVLARGLLAQLRAESAAGGPAVAVPRCPDLAPDAVAWILEHDWPGNVRELKSALAHALVMSDGAAALDAACFPRLLLHDARQSEYGLSSAPASGPMSGPVSGTRRRDDLFRDAIAVALRESDGNVSEAARKLGVARSTLYRRLPARGKA